MELTKSQLVTDLRDNLAIAPGDLIAVHSSMKSIGRVAGSATTLIEALIEAVGGEARGTVMMPCMPEPMDVVDVLRSGCKLGLVPETFRTFPGVELSENPTHRVAVFGKDAKAIAATHAGRSPLGPGTPFHELARRGGSVLHIGCNMRACSLVHVAEWIFPLPYNSAQITYPGYDKDITLICADGRQIVCPPKDNPGDSAGFLVLQREMEKYGLIHRGTLGTASCIKARGLDILAIAMELLARDPVCLLCENPKCPVCPQKRKIASATGGQSAKSEMQ